MRIKFLKTPEQKSRLKGPLKLFNIYRRDSSHGKNRYLVLELNIKRILVSMCVMFVLGYVGSTIGLFMWVDKQKHNQISYWDIALPHRWTQIDELNGQTKLAQAFESFEKQEYKSSIFKFRSGLARYPYDFEARTKLAQLYIALKRPKLAIDILRVGFDYGKPDDAYIQTFFTITSVYNQYEIAEAVAEKLLADPEIQSSPDKIRSLFQIQVDALMAAEDYEALLETTREINAMEDTANQFYDAEAFALIRLGRIDEALILIETYKIQGAKDRDLDLLYLDAIFETRNTEQIELAYARLKKEYPENATLRSNYIVRSLELGEQQNAKRELTEFSWMFGHDSAVIFEISAKLAHLGNSNLIETFKVLPLAENPTNRSRLDSYQIQALLQESRWSDAQNLGKKWGARLTENDEYYKMARWVHLLTETMIEHVHANVIELETLLKEERFPYQVYLQTANAFESINRWERAQKFLDLGLAHHPFHSKLSKLKDDIQTLQDSAHLDRHSQISGIIQQKTESELSIQEKSEDATNNYMQRLSRFKEERQKANDYPNFGQETYDIERLKYE